MSDHPRQADLRELLRELFEAGVQFLIVGGVAAVLHGAPITTQDLDIVPERSEGNLLRLLEMLQRLEANVREPGDRRIEPTIDHLRAGGQLLLLTRYGPLDVRGRLHDGRSFVDLEPESETISDGRQDLRVLDLKNLIAIKSSTGRARDRLTVPYLLALWKERDTGGAKSPPAGSGDSRDR